MDEEKFRRFYESHALALSLYVLQLTGDRELTNDIMQDSFIRWFQKAPPGMSDRAGKSYLFRIATNLVHDHRRRRKPERLTDETEKREADQQSPDEKIDFKAAFDRLSATQKSMLWLAHAEDYSHEEIGEILKIKKGSVKVLLFRARKRLAQLIHERI